MNPCFSTLGCDEMDWPAAAALARKHNIRHIELRALGGRTDLPAYLHETFGTPEAFAARATADGIAVPMFDTSFSLHAGDEAARTALLDAVPWAEALGARWLRVFDGGKFDPSAGEGAFDIPAGAIAWWRRQRARHGWKVDLAVETHDFLCASRLIQGFQRRLGVPIPVLWDSFHIWFQNGETPSETWTAIRPWVVHIHFKDAIREPILHYPYHYVPPGQGVYPLRDLIRILQADGYAGAFSLEWERKWHPYLAPLDEVLAASRPFLQELQQTARHPNPAP